MKESRVFFTSILILFFTGIIVPIYAQAPQTMLNGTVIDVNGSSLDGVSLIVEEEDIGTYTDNQGKFRLELTKPGSYTLHVEYIGYTSQIIHFSIAEGETLNYNFTLESSDYLLEQIKVTEKTEATKAGEQTITAQVLDVRSMATLPATLTNVMNRSAGVRVRESGGLGNNVDVSLNGFQGRSVRYFKDGIPLDYLGAGYGISVAPLNVIDRIEVYKGVLPVNLGADALGGAINLVSSSSTLSGLQASYEIGSYNTHRITLAGQYVNKSGKLFAGMESYYNYSDNNYEVLVRVPDPETKNPSWQSVELFHNGYRGYYAEVYTGAKNLTWADEIRFSLSGFGIDREQQHPTMMSTPYGAIQLLQKAIVPTLRYRKSFWDDKLEVDQFIAYSNINRNRIDTLHGNYTWLGEFIPNPHKVGESPQPALSDVNFRNITSRTFFKLHLSPNHSIENNIVVTHIERQGEDPYGIRFLNTDIDVLSIPANYFKIVESLGWSYRFIQDRMQNDLILKFFSYQSEGVDGYRSLSTSLQDIQRTVGNSWGIAEGLKFQIDRNNLLRLSAEYTSRLPDQMELFGDSDTRVPNFDLKPERSLNINLNYKLTRERYRLETGILYRRTEGMILLIPIQPPFAQHQNLENVRGYGIDVDMEIKLFRGLYLSANATWLNNRMYGITAPLDRWKEGTRLRNTPFFYYNLGLKGEHSDLIGTGDNFRYYIYHNYIREFYLDFIPQKMEPNGFLGLWGESGVDITTKIPDQHLLTAGFQYKLHSLPVSMGFEVRNLTNARLYDLYRVEKAGRSYHLKFSYSIKKSK